MKKFLLLLLCSTAAHADIFDLQITQQNFHCTPKVTCKIFADFDVMIVNETNEPEHYDLGYNLQIANPSSVSGKHDHIDIKPRGIFRKHYHLDWEKFVLEKSNSYLMRGAIVVANQPQATQLKTTTIWVY